MYSIEIDSSSFVPAEDHSMDGQDPDQLGEYV